MPCPVPSHLPTPPTLTTLLDDLVSVDPARAEQHRATALDMERRQLQLREQLAAAESTLSLVKPDGSRQAHSDWCLRSTNVNSCRQELRMLGADADSFRAELERELFLARQSRALGRTVCQACGGSGDGELIDGGTCLVPSPCDACAGSGFASRDTPGHSES